MHLFRTGLAGVLVMSASVVAAHAAPHHNKPAAASGASAPIAVVKQFELAYEHKDKKTMLLKLMVPTTDEGAMEKRDQWLRGYGPHDMPGSVHPPILFETSKGSFVPTSYTITQSKPVDASHYRVTVREEGTYRDEDGRYRVKRVRLFTLTNYKGHWYVLDYVMQENPEDYGFFVDDISDKMESLGK